MGTQNKWERMPLPPKDIPPHVVPMWRDRGRMLAKDYRHVREMFREMTGGNLALTLNALRMNADNLSNSPAARYRFLVMYRSALNEAVVSRHWTVIWSALTNQHEIR
jgi:hypothetical protein